jgi:tetratricopeptide (TPR) repeat protein
MAAVIGAGVVYLAVDYEMKRPVAGPSPEYTMPDGTILTLRKVTFGQQHRFDVDRPVRRFALFAGMGRNAMSEFTSTDSIMIWLSRRDAATGRALDFDWWSHSVAVDEHGCEFVDEQPGRNAFSPSGSTGESGSRPFSSLAAQQSSLNYQQIVAHSSLRPFRHAGDSFKLRIFDLEGTAVAVFDVPDPSPARGKFPVWEPEPLPATKTAGDLSVTLKTLTGSKGDRYVGSNNKAETIRLNADLDVTLDGERATEWTRRNVSVFDALGNLGSTWDCHFCPREQAWKVQVRVFRDATAKFDPSEQWTVPAVPVPAANKAEPLSGTQSVQGVNVELVAAGGSGSVTHTNVTTNYSGSWGSSGSVNGPTKNYPLELNTQGQRGAGATTKVQCELPHVVARFKGITEDHYTPDLRVADDQRREVKAHGPTSHADDSYFWFLEPPPDAKTLDLTFIVQKGRKVEFVVAPPAVEPLKGVVVDPSSPAAKAQRMTRVRRQIDELRSTLRSESNNAAACNELAWTYATAPDELRDIAAAVEFAERAVAIEPANATFQNTLAVAHAHAGQHEKAVAAALPLDAAESDWRFTLGRYTVAVSQSKLGDSAAATESYRDAFRRHSIESSKLSPFEDQELKNARTDAMTQLLGATPAEVFAKANQLARAGSWREAAAEYVRALEIYPDEHWNWFVSAGLLIETNDPDGYRRHCRTMLNRFGGTVDGHIAERTAKACLFIPDGLPGDPRPAALATKAVHSNPNFAWFLLAKGIAEYRSGNSEDAVTWLDKAKQGPSNNVHSLALADLFLALSHHRLGNADTARRSLDDASKIIDQQLPLPGSTNIGDAWHDWLMCHIVRREADGLMGRNSKRE